MFIKALDGDECQVLLAISTIKKFTGMPKGDKVQWFIDTGDGEEYYTDELPQKVLDLIAE